MRIEKILNNNIVSSIDSKGRELVIMGKGIGFSSRAGEEIDDSKVEKIFKLNNNDESRHFQEIIEDMPIEHIRLSNEIISYAKETIKADFNRSIYITLTDHLNFAIERFRKNMNFSNKLRWEIEKFYLEEFQVGLKALDIIESELEIRLPEDEAASIAMHLINAELGDSNIEETVKITKLIQNCMNIVRYHYSFEPDEKSIYYSRFVTHLMYFAQRLFNNELHTCNDDEDSELCDMVRCKYVEAYKCAAKIKKYIHTEYGYNMTDEEMMYITVHIKRITTK